MTTREQVTFCRICEPFCGMIATVEDDKLVSLRPDREHPLTKGFACPKGMAYPEVQNDPDRVLRPLKRAAGGSFEPVSWDEALDDIAARLARIRAEHGKGSVGYYFGNPSALNMGHVLWSQLFLRALGVRHLYSAGSQDISSRLVANYLLYGQMWQIPIPDLEHTELLVIMGANPVVSHMSLCSAPRVADQLRGIEERGGRVLVVDPRRTETAREHEWLPIVPDSDAWFLLSLVQVLFAEGLVDSCALRRVADGHESLRDLAEDFTPEATESLTGIAPEVVRSLARDLVVKKAVLYGRTGTCLGSSATLVNILMDAVNVLTGNLDVRGGAVFGQGPLPLKDIDAHTGALSSYQPGWTRIGKLPRVLGTEPAALMAAEMTTPGEGQIKAMFVVAGNPVLSTPDGPGLEKAMAGLDLMVSLDLYVNETNQHADYILPTTAMYEREDLPILNGGFYLKPFVQATRAVVPAPGETRQEWEILQDILDRMGLSPFPLPLPRQLTTIVGRLGLRLTPHRLVDALVRMGRGGDRFGLRPRGLNLERLLDKHPHGLVFAEQVEVGTLAQNVRHRSKRVRLDHAEIAGEVDRLRLRRPDEDYPLRLIGMREPRSENSWMHNVAALRVARPPHSARMHPQDAEDLGLVHLGPVRLVSATGAIELPVFVTEDISPGVVAVPHGWGHRGGGWQRANHEPGANVNELTTTDPAGLEQLAGMSHLSGVHVRAERVAAVVPTEA